MENNEQQNQDSVVNEGVENEQITLKAPKKAIDSNEKKKIVKLIQPSILPAKVRIGPERNSPFWLIYSLNCLLMPF